MSVTQTEEERLQDGLWRFRIQGLSVASNYLVRARPTNAIGPADAYCKVCKLHTLDVPAPPGQVRCTGTYVGRFALECTCPSPDVQFVEVAAGKKLLLMPHAGNVGGGSRWEVIVP